MLLVILLDDYNSVNGTTTDMDQLRNISPARNARVRVNIENIIFL